ncbi:MAG: hypothetical protein LUH58_10195 [Lachnospiraceae bacterium]|nr:hypothetical protein [Lachnospiraceae bacterium]
MYDSTLDASSQNEAFCCLWLSYEAFVKQLIRATFNEYYGHENKEDLNSILMSCMWSNSRGYNPSNGAYTTYIKPYLLHDVSIFISKEWWNLSSYYGTIYKKILMAENSLIAEGSDITLETLMEKTSLSALTINKCLDQIPRRISDSDIIEDFDNIAVDRTSSTPEALVLQNEQDAIIRKCIFRLPEELRQIIVLYCGFDGERYTVTEISRLMGQTRDYVNRLFRKACSELKASLKEEQLI